MIYLVEIKDSQGRWCLHFQTYNKRDAAIEAKYQRKFNDKETRVRATA